MVLPNLIFIPLVIWPLVFINFDFASSRVISKHDVLPSQGDCVNCSICPYPCHSMSPPPPHSSEYPLYGAPPQPAASIYPSYEAPPPLPEGEAQGNCPPAFPAQCCRYPGPPNTYTYFPNDSFSSNPFPTVFLVSIILMLPASFAVLF